MVEKSRKQAQSVKNPEDEEDRPDEVVKFDETQYAIRRKVDKLSPVFLSKSQRPALIS
jgi:hypothetical protein